MAVSGPRAPASVGGRGWGGSTHAAASRLPLRAAPAPPTSGGRHPARVTQMAGGGAQTPRPPSRPTARGAVCRRGRLNGSVSRSTSGGWPAAGGVADGRHGCGGGDAAAVSTWLAPCDGRESQRKRDDKRARARCWGREREPAHMTGRSAEDVLNKNFFIVDASQQPAYAAQDAPSPLPPTGPPTALPPTPGRSPHRAAGGHADRSPPPRLQ